MLARKSAELLPSNSARPAKPEIVLQSEFSIAVAFIALAAQTAFAAGTADSGIENALVLCDAEALNEALANGANANWRNDSGESALHYAVECVAGVDGDQYALVQALLKAGAVATAVTPGGASVLERTLLFGSEPTIGLLLQAGANPNKLATTGSSLLAIAQVIGNEGALRSLKMYGAMPLAQDQEMVEQWSGIADLLTAVDIWMDSNPDDDGKFLDVYTGLLRQYLGHNPDVARELAEFEAMEYPDSLSAAPVPLLEARQQSNCPSNCSKDYRACVGGCGGGWSGVACRVTCGRQRSGCNRRCDKMLPVEVDKSIGGLENRPDRPPSKSLSGA